MDVRLKQAVTRCAATGVTLGDENVCAGTVIWAAGIGDTALAQDVAGEPLPGIAPVAKQQGAYVAEAILERITGEAEPPPFHY